MLWVFLRYPISYVNRESGSIILILAMLKASLHSLIPPMSFAIGVSHTMLRLSDSPLSTRRQGADAVDETHSLRGSR